MRLLQVSRAAQISFLQENRITPELRPYGNKLNKVYNYWVFFTHADPEITE